MDHEDDDHQPSAGAKLKKLRLHAGLSVREMAERLGVRSHSTYNGWETEYKRPYMTWDRVQKLAAVLVGLGDPAITKQEVLALAGVGATPSGKREPLQRSPNPPGTGLLIREYDVGPSAGYGAEPPVLNGDGETPILAEWSMPEDLVRAHTTPGRRLALIRVEGNSMEPDYHPGERVLVDLSRRKPSPPGEFVIWDGMGLVLKRVELVPGLIPRRIRLMSINPGYTPYEVELDEHTIVARVIGKWQWR